MRASISIVLGIIIVFLCYQLIKREINNAVLNVNSKYGHISDENTREVIANLDNIENTVNELNRSFYEVVSDLEGKFSIHDKEIEILTEKIDENTKFIEKNIKKISNEISEGKKNINIISNAQQNNGKILKKINNQNKVDNDANNGSKDFISTEKNRENTNSVTVAIKDRAGSEEKEVSNVRSSRIFVESLNENEKEKLRENIIELRHKGFSVNQIAKKLGVGVGELQLVLNLHRK